ncbi:NINE protein [Phyllobacterium sp. 0TCS1.6C]|uniref:TM2 domain-containing protein n=1 Tax=unclassified Phyllobacterium TaxID=2638441 RepID=UPI002264EEDC|nr:MULTISPECIES: NINE protein [unclassified Phyllobacterium]MCX8282450.1 NINE protein [Phyllobacterium sp. 0TCS1.6C]MCX8292542.1 NINE protein [Phyllobacterium sp. 0TCS1.6A]
MTLTTQDRMLIEQRVTNDAKSTGAAYVIWFFLGTLGMHRFYLGRTGSGAIMLILFIIGAVTAVAGVGLIILGLLGLWALIDAFLIPGMVQKQKEQVRQRLTKEALTFSGG